MRNYGFDYLVEKVQVLNEMARPNYWSFNFPEFNNEIYLPTANAISKIGKVTSSGHVREKTIEYLMISMLSIFKYGLNFSAYVKKVSKVSPGQKRENFSDGFNQWMDDGGWKWSPQKEKEYALFTIVQKHYKKILSPEIKEQLLNPENIIEYLDAPSDQQKKNDDEIYSPEDIEYVLQKEKESYNTSPQELAIKRTKLFLKNRTNLSPEDIEYIKRNPRGFLDKDGKTSLDIHDFRELIGSTKEESPTMKSGGRRIPKTSHAAQIYNKKLSDKIGMDRYEKDSIYAAVTPLLTQIRKLQKLESKGQLRSESPEIYFGELLNQQIAYFTTLKLGRTRGASKLDIQLAKSPQLTDELLGDLSDFIENDPEMTKEKFLQHISTYDSKDLLAFGNYLVKKAQESVSEITPNESMNYDGYSENVLHEVLDTPEKKKVFDQWYRISRKMKKPVTEIQSESFGVMGYLKEQVEKDRLINSRGEFKDRGFKRPKNYAHWMWLNEQ